MSDDRTDELWAWGDSDREPRLLHTMLRVGNLERSLAFYCDLLGMHVLKRYDFESGRFSILFLSFSDDYRSGAIELTHNWDRDGYDVGNGYGHVAIGVPDFLEQCERMKARGVEFTSEPMRMMEGAPLLAIARDPDGYAVELIQTARDAPGDPAPGR